jgi:WD40 repeat protein
MKQGTNGNSARLLLRAAGRESVSHAVRYVSSALLKKMKKMQEHESPHLACWLVDPLWYALPCSGLAVLQDSVHTVAHRKIFREFTDLRLVQTLSGHEGVVWKIAFNDTASLMASAGKDRSVRVWRCIRGPLDRSPFSTCALRWPRVQTACDLLFELDGCSSCFACCTGFLQEIS